MTHDLTPRTTSSTSPRALSADGSAVPEAWVVDLFGRLTAIVGAVAMDAVYAGCDPVAVKREWAEALAGFTAAEVQHGLASVRLRKFAPNLPDFLHLCRPSLDPEVAWHEAWEGLRAWSAGEAFAWSHPAVYWAGRAMWQALRESSFAQSRRRWEAQLQAEWQRGQWDPVPAPQPKLERPGRQQDLPEVPGQRAAITQRMRALGDRLRVQAGMPPRQSQQASAPFTQAELEDRKNADRLAGRA